jgi:hypothetical protein
MDPNGPQPAKGTCDFCSKEFDLPGKYIYPVPSQGPKMDNRVGKVSCPDCYPALRQAQIDEGLVVPPGKSYLNIHAWKEIPK